MELYIDSVAEQYLHDSLSIDDVIDERTTCQFQVIDTAGAKTFAKGQPYEIYDGATLIAAGVIDSAKYRVLPGGQRLHRVTGADWHYLADKRVCAEAYASTAAGAIVKDLVDNYLAAEGVTYTLTSVQDGPTILEAVFNYVPVSQAIESLTDKAGYVWYIDVDKILYFMARSTNAAPWAAAKTDMLDGSVSLESTNSKYRNRQYVRGGKDITDAQTEIAVGDGESRAFVVGYPIAKVPTVEISLNGGAYAAGTVGIRGLDTGKDWYWSKGSNTISQDDSGTVLTAVDKIKVVYQGEFDIVILSQSCAAIAEQLAIEGAGTGYNDDVIDDQSISSREAGFQVAAQALNRYGAVSRRLKFRTRRSGLKPGQLLTVTMTEYGLTAAEMLIEAVTISTDSTYVWYDVTAVEGPEMGSWAQLFKTMATRGEAFVVRENIKEEQILITLETFAKTWIEAEEPNIFRVVRPAADLFPGAATFPAFATADRVKYLAWYDGTGELGRKAITQQSGVDVISTTTYLAPFEANETITHVGWFGGHLATATVGTGVEVDKQAYAKVKTELEAIQIDKTDTRWA